MRLEFLVFTREGLMELGPAILGSVLLRGSGLYAMDRSRVLSAWNSRIPWKSPPPWSLNHDYTKRQAHAEVCYEGFGAQSFGFKPCGFNP